MYEIQMYMINFIVSIELCKLNSTYFILEKLVQIKYN